MAVKIEQRQQSMIQAASLPDTRLHTGDLGLERGTQILAGAALQKSQKQNADDEAYRKYEAGRAGMADGSQRPVLGPNGWETVERPINQSLEYLQGFDRAVAMNMATSFESLVTGRLAEIQSDPAIKSEDKPALMSAVIDGAIKGSPEELRANFTAWGQNQISARSEQILAAEAKKQTEMTDQDMRIGIETNTNDAMSAVKAGNMPAADAHIGEIRKRVENLVTRKRISLTQADTYFREVSQDVYQAGYGAKIIESMYLKGNVSPEEVNRLAGALEGGGKGFTINIGTEVLDVNEIRKNVPDQKRQRQLAADIRGEANRVQSLANANAGKQEYANALQNASRTFQLPSTMKSDFDEHMSILMKGDAWLDDPQSQLWVIETSAKAKVFSKTMGQKLEMALNANQPEYIDKVANFLQQLKGYRNQWEDHVGLTIWRDMPPEMAAKFDAVLAAKNAGIPSTNVMAAVQEVQKAGSEVYQQLRNVWRDYANDEKGGDIVDISTHVRQAWTDKYGSAMMPLGYEKEVEQAFYMNMLITGSGKDKAKQAMDNAVLHVSSMYSESQIFLEGGARTGMGDFTNPNGYEPDLGVGRAPWTRAVGSDLQWIEDFVKETLETGRFASGEQALLDDLYASGETVLGKTLFLKPVPNSGNPPEFEVWRKDASGPTAITEPVLDLDNQPFRINPGSERSQIEMRFRHAEEKRLAAESAEDYQKRILYNMIDMGSLVRERRSIPGIEEMMQVLPDGKREYITDRMGEVRKSLDRLRRTQEYEAGQPVSKVEINDATLIQPRASGRDVVASTVQIIESVLPDGTGGSFMRNTALVESNNGKERGTFRMRGDKGLWQVNTSKGFVEVHRRANIPGDRVANAVDKVKAVLGIDIRKMTEADLDKPLIGGLFARLYYIAATRDKVPKNIDEQAQLWKKYYNTRLGSGSVKGFKQAVMASGS